MLLKLKNVFTILLLVMTVLLNIKAEAQSHSNTYTVSKWWGPPKPKFSPVIHNDNTITFRVNAPDAEKVEVILGEWTLIRKDMQKDSAGIWSATLGPVEPEIYGYNFIIDGLKTIDMMNPEFKSGTIVYSSVVEVPGNPPRFDELQNVPHGRLQVLQYTSTPLQRWRQVYVYLPHNYYTEPEREFPVLYLRHGGGDNESNWYTDGKAGVILDNLLAEDKAEPCIVVMTDGMTDGSWAGASSPEGIKALEDELLTDVIPLIENSFRTLDGPESRAIAGLSMGGGQAFIIGLHNPDTFDWIGEFGSGLIASVEYDPEISVPKVKDAEYINNNLRLLFIGCGTLDPRYNGHLNLIDNLNERGIKNEFFEMKGGHEWKVWRHMLHEFLQNIFR